MRKFTKEPEKNKKQKLTRTSLSRPFIIAFQRKLERGYQFIDLEKADLKQFQRFLDIASELTVQQMDTKYKQEADKKDTVDDFQVEHYRVGDGFRIHGIYREGRFEVLRLDPHHNRHK
jgi:hypothetical protein